MTTEKPKPQTVAVLDGENKLIGYETVENAEGRIVVPDGCDLPADGTYKWDPAKRSFIPLGFGFGRPGKPPVDEHYALFQVIRALGKEVGPEARAWADWYDQNLRQKTEERMVVLRRRNRGK